MAEKVTSEVDINYKSVGADQVNEDLKKTQEGLDNVSRSGGETERVTLNVTNRFQALERQLGTAAGNQQQYQQRLDLINRAMAQNPEFADRGAEAIEKLKARYLDAGDATLKLADAHKGLDAQGQAALHSIRSLTEQIAMGAPITQALTSQMSHLSFAASGEGGIAGAFAQAGSSIKGMATAAVEFLGPGGIFAASVAAAAAGLTYLAVKAADARKQMDNALSGPGGATGTQPADINRFAEQNTSITGMAIAQARAVGQEFASTGKIAINELTNVGVAVEGLAAKTKSSYADAGKELAKLFSATDLTKSVDALSGMFPELNAEVRKSVDSFQAAGERSKALQLIIDTIGPSSLRAAGNIDTMTQAAAAFGNAIGNALTRVDTTTLESKLAQVRKEMEETLNVPTPNMAMWEELAKKAAALEAEIAKLKATAATTSLNVLSNEVTDIVEKTNPAIALVRELTLEINKLKEAQAKGAPGANTDAANAALQILEDRLKKATAAADANTIAMANNTAQMQANVSVLGTAATAEEVANAKIAAVTLALQQNTISADAAARAIANIRDQYAATQVSAAALAASQSTLGSLMEENTGRGNTLTFGLDKNTAAVKDSTNAHEINGRVLYDNSTAAKDNAQAQQEQAKAQQEAAQRAREEAAAAKQAEEAAKRQAAAAKAAAEANLAWQRGLAAAYQGLLQIAGAPTTMSQLGVPYAPDYTGASMPVSATLYGNIFGQYNRGQTSGIGTVMTDKGLYLDPTGQLTAYQQQEKANQAAYASQSIGDYIDTIIKGGGIQAGLSAAMSQTGKDQYGGGGRFAESDILSEVQSLYSTLNQGASQASQISNTQAELAWLQSRPASAAQQSAIARLKDSLDNLTKSTNDLNATNQDLLSPYYTQDPRTSHIGFRSQGMAQGGYVDVPGATSANDNMIAVVPVASGERIYVDPMYSRRGLSAGANFTINVSSPVMFAGNPNKDEVGRTMYQNNQNLVKQLRSAMQ